MVRITRSPSHCLTRPLQLQVKESINNQDDEGVLTSFLSASKIRVFSCPKLSLILALLLFSIIGLDDYRNEKHNDRTVTILFLFFVLRKMQSSLWIRGL